MKTLHQFSIQPLKGCSLLLVLALLAIPVASVGQSTAEITITPPALPVYAQPSCPGEGYLWTPGYWLWNEDVHEYYWVPGTWVLAPEASLLWTPGWWGWGGQSFIFHEGFWGTRVGFYGGINYGFGYFGVGYEGGRWTGGHFYYNRAVNNVNVTSIQYVYNTVVNNATGNRVSYNGHGGIDSRPTLQEEAAASGRHIPPTAAQAQHMQAARGNPQLRFSVNQGRPPIAATEKPGEFSGPSVVAAQGATTSPTPPSGILKKLAGIFSTTAKDQDPPGRIARLAYPNSTSATVSLQAAGERELTHEVANRPLTSGDRLWTNQGAVAELQIGSTSLRMASETDLTFVVLDNHTTQLKVAQGSVIVRLRHLDDEERVEIDTPHFVCAVEQPGEYRLDLASDGNAMSSAVWKGKIEITASGITRTVVSGQRVRFNATYFLKQPEIERIPSPDDFDNWAASRDQQDDKSESSNYISKEITGYQDLDNFGQWSYVADYGAVWTPAGLAPGWVPYRFGHWVWIEPWGWTWVEDEPWGFAPFHYGRWAFANGGWRWVPGPVVVRPVFAPALVAFVTASFPPFVDDRPIVAWFPLAPTEVFVPWYQTSRTYVNSVNITNTRVTVARITEVYNAPPGVLVRYANRQATAVTAVPQDVFVRGGTVAHSLSTITQTQIADAALNSSLPPRPSGDIRGLEPIVKAEASRAVSVGRNYALLFAGNEYTYWPHLNNPIDDARTIADELRKNYGFETKLVQNPHVDEIVNTLHGYAAQQYGPADQLFIYFAGHGFFDKTEGEGFLVATESKLQNDDKAHSSYLDFSRLDKIIDNLPARHIFLVLDVCYGGAFDERVTKWARDRGADEYADVEAQKYIQRKLEVKGRLYLTSGQITSVPDGKPGRNSPFARKFIEVLRTYGGKEQLITTGKIVENVERLEPEPRFGEFGDSKPGADFLFIPK